MVAVFSCSVLGLFARGKREWKQWLTSADDVCVCVSFGGSLRTSWGGEAVTKRDSIVSLCSFELLPSEAHFRLFLFKFLWAQDGLAVK